MTRIALVLCLMAPSLASAETRQVRGTLRFNEYTSGGATYVRAQPIRFVTVTIKRGSTVLSTAQTGHDGYFSRWIDVAELPAGQILTIELEAENYAAHVYL